MIVSKSLPIRMFLNKAILDITERGQLNRIMKKWEMKKSYCSMSSEDNPLGIKKLSTLFIIIIIGYGLGLITLMVEILIMKNNSKHIQKMRDENELCEKTSTDELMMISKYVVSMQAFLINKAPNSYETVTINHHLEEINNLILNVGKKK